MSTHQMVSRGTACPTPRTPPRGRDRRTSGRTGLLVVLGIALVYTVIALAGTLLMATSARTGELASLRVVAGEALFAVAVGAVLGAAVTAVNLAGPAGALWALAAPVTVAVPWGTAGLALGACAVVAALSAVAGCPRTARR
ncbi:hypothetical protein ACF08N_19100 [Streptomyces sp. NPDC015127]|uniref:hypothetical protein n=1 Tax=Streptomyces sp. NPDC015127 TaxID=3364939 RepID=UPI0036FE96CF